MSEAVLVALAPLIGPLVTAGIRLLLPSIPKLLLPIICTVVGTASAILGGAQSHEALALGGSGVAVREVVSQATKGTDRNALYSFLVGLICFAPLFSLGCSSLSAPVDTTNANQQKALAIARTLSIGTCLTVSEAVKQSERQQALAALQIVSGLVTNATPDTYQAQLETLLGQQNQKFVPMAASVAVTVATLTSEYVDQTVGRELVLQILAQCQAAFTAPATDPVPKEALGSPG